MIRLEKFNKESYGYLIAWVDSEEMLMQFAGPAFTFPLTNNQLDKSLEDTKRFAFKVIDNTTNNYIGHCELYLTDTTFVLGRILIGDKNLRGKGLGKLIVNLLLELGFNSFGRNVAELNVFDWNISAIKCYTKVGFTINPHKRCERKIKDNTWTAINMTLDKRIWQNPA